MLDTKAIAQATAEVVKAHVKEAVSPLLARINVLEKQIEAQNEVKEWVSAEISKVISAIPEPVPPVEIDTQAIVDKAVEYFDDTFKAINTELKKLEGMNDAIKSEVEKAVSELPKPQDGKDADIESIKSFIVEEVAKIPAPKDGQDADMEALKAHIDEKFAQMPVPKDGEDGKDADMEALKSFIAEKIAELPKPADGVGLAGAMIDRDGELNLTTTKGEVIKLGRVVGDKGEDGFSLDDFDVAQKEDGRTLVFKFERGNTVFEAEFSVPTMIYRGVWKEGTQYERGDTVTYGGALWHCNGGDLEGQWKGTTDAKPAENAKNWTLAVRKGRDGKDLREPNFESRGVVKL